MDDKIYNYFKEEYEKVNVPEGIERKILTKDKRKIFTLAAISSSIFVVFILSLVLEFSPTFDSVISNIVFP